MLNRIPSSFVNNFDKFAFEFNRLEQQQNMRSFIFMTAMRYIFSFQENMIFLLIIELTT